MKLKTNFFCKLRNELKIEPTVVGVEENSLTATPESLLWMSVD